MGCSRVFVTWYCETEQDNRTAVAGMEVGVVGAELLNVNKHENQLISTSAELSNIAKYFVNVALPYSLSSVYTVSSRRYIFYLSFF